MLQYTQRQAWWYGCHLKVFKNSTQKRKCYEMYSILCAYYKCEMNHSSTHGFYIFLTFECKIEWFCFLRDDFKQYITFQTLIQTILNWWSRKYETQKSNGGTFEMKKKKKKRTHTNENDTFAKYSIWELVETTPKLTSYLKCHRKLNIYPSPEQTNRKSPLYILSGAPNASTLISTRCVRSHQKLAIELKLRHWY